MPAPSLPPHSLPFLHLVVDINLIVVPLPVRWPARSEVPSNPPFLASPAISVLSGVLGLGLERTCCCPPSHTPMYIGMQLPLWFLGLRTISTESLFFRGPLPAGALTPPPRIPPAGPVRRLCTYEITDTYSGEGGEGRGSRRSRRDGFGVCDRAGDVCTFPFSFVCFSVHFLLSYGAFLQHFLGVWSWELGVWAISGAATTTIPYIRKKYRETFFFVQVSTYVFFLYIHTYTHNFLD